MIMIETDRIYTIYIRTNRNTPWKYATFCGRYRTPGEAVLQATRRVREPFEYMIGSLEDESFRLTGFAGQEKEKADVKPKGPKL